MEYSTSLTNITQAATSVVYNGYVYEIGGFNGSNAVMSVYYGALTPPPPSNNTNTSSSSLTTSSTSTNTSDPKTPDTGYGEPTHLSPIVTLMSIVSVVSISLGLALIYKRRHSKA